MIGSIIVIPGFQTDPNGECLGLRSFVDTAKSRYQIYKSTFIAWDQLQPTMLIAAMTPSPDAVTIGICHSYGGAASKKALDQIQIMNMFDLWIWLDPVPRIWWGQFNLPWWKWKTPTAVRRNIQFFQNNLPPNGHTFSNIAPQDTYNVTKWGGGAMQHCDIPHSPQVQQIMLKEIGKLFEKLVAPQ